MIRRQVSQVVANGDSRSPGEAISRWLRSTPNFRNGFSHTHEEVNAESNWRRHSIVCQWDGVRRSVNRCRGDERKLDGIPPVDGHKHLLRGRIDLGIPAPFVHISQVYSTITSYIIHMQINCNRDNTRFTSLRYERLYKSGSVLFLTSQGSRKHTVFVLQDMLQPHLLASRVLGTRPPNNGTTERRVA